MRRGSSPRAWQSTAQSSSFTCDTYRILKGNSGADVLLHLTFEHASLQNALLIPLCLSTWISQPQGFPKETDVQFNSLVCLWIASKVPVVETAPWVRLIFVPAWFLESRWSWIEIWCDLITFQSPCQMPILSHTKTYDLSRSNAVKLVTRDATNLDQKTSESRQKNYDRPLLHEKRLHKRGQLLTPC
jgi:hypothetical protein